MTNKDTEITKGKAGRPTKMTDEVVKKLVACFSNGFSDQLACDHVGIDKVTLYNYCDKRPEFSTIKERLKKNPVAAATLNIVKAIDSGDVKASQWYLERKCKDEFSTRTENTGENGEPLQIPTLIIEGAKFDNMKTIENDKN